MRECPKCHAALDDDAVYCDKCGFKLPQIDTCPYCGSQLKSDSVFCPKCGKHVLTDETITLGNEYKINQYMNEIALYKQKRLVLIRFGCIFFVLGLLFLITSILVWVFYFDTPSAVSACVFGVIFGFMFVFAGVAFLIVQSAVFGNKIINRKNRINELTKE